MAERATNFDWEGDFDEEEEEQEGDPGDEEEEVSENEEQVPETDEEEELAENDEQLENEVEANAETGQKNTSGEKVVPSDVDADEGADDSGSNDDSDPK